MHGTHLEDLTDRIKPRTASNMLLWFVVALRRRLLRLGGASPSSTGRCAAMGRVIPSSQLQVVSNLEGGIVEDILVRAGQQVRAGDALIRLDRDPDRRRVRQRRGDAHRADRQDRPPRRPRSPGREPVYPAAADPVARRPDPDRAGAARLAHGRSRRPASAPAQRAAQPGRARASPRPRPTYQARAAACDAAPRRGADHPAAGRARHRAAAQPDPGRERRRRRRERGGRPPPQAIGRARAGVAEARSALAQAQPGMARPGGERARHRPGRARRPPPRPAGARRPGSSAPCCARRCRAGSTASSSPPAAARSAPASRWSRSCPSEESLLIEARVRPQDIAFVRIGQHARVAITAYDRSIYGVLEGSVVGISPDAVARGADRRDLLHGPRPHRPRTRCATRDGRPMPIGPGMVAEVDLLGDKRTDPAIYPVADHPPQRDGAARAIGPAGRRG